MTVIDNNGLIQIMIRAIPEIIVWGQTWGQKMKLIYHFYNVNTYMWCYQYTGTIMIQSWLVLLFGKNPQAVA